MCDRCSSERVAYVCNECGAYRFCSLECADALALAHAGTCYDRESADREYLARLAGPLLVGNEWTAEEAHALLGERLKRTPFDASTMEFIALRGSRGRARKPAKKSRRRRKNRSRAGKRKKSPGLRRMETINVP